MKNKWAGQFGINVRRLREMKALTQEELAELAGLHPNYIGFIERGTRNITMEKIVKLGKALECKSSQLFKDIF